MQRAAESQYNGWKLYVNFNCCNLKDKWKSYLPFEVNVPLIPQVIQFYGYHSTQIFKVIEIPKNCTQWGRKSMRIFKMPNKMKRGRFMSSRKSFIVVRKKIISEFKSSHRRCSVRKGVLRNFAKFTGKRMCQSPFFNKIASQRLDF